MGSKNSHIHEMSFKNDQLELFFEIEIRCRFINKSGWLKEAAFEKLQREKDFGQWGNNLNVIPDNDKQQISQVKPEEIIKSSLSIKSDNMGDMMGMFG